VRRAARGLSKIVKRYPKVEVVDTTRGDWDVTKVARIGETLLSKFPKIDPAYFHNDDMALAAYDVMKAHNRTSIKIGGCDATPPALQAVMDGRMVATVRNPSCLIHGGAIIAGVVATVSGEKDRHGTRNDPEAHRDGRTGSDQGQRAWPGMDGKALPDLSDVPWHGQRYHLAEAQRHGFPHLLAALRLTGLPSRRRVSWKDVEHLQSPDRSA
jgi:hypothetical protein